MKRHTRRTCVAVAGGGVLLAVTCLTVNPAGAALVGYWALSENSGTTASDSSGTSPVVDGTLIGGAWDSNGILGGALSLDGVNDRVQVLQTSDVADLKYTGGNLTLSAWVYPAAGETTSGYIFSKPWNGSGKYNYRLRIEGSSSNRVALYLGGAASGSAGIASGYYPHASFAETWHHVAAVLDAANQMTLYLDGTEVNSATHSITDWTGLDIDRPLCLGTLYPYGSTWSGRTDFSLEGKIDDAAIWSDALNPGQVRSLYTVPQDLGLDYDVAQMIDLWDIHTTGPGGQGMVDGSLWMYSDELPDIVPGTPPNGGDAYVGPRGLFYVALADGSGVFRAPEPSTFFLAFLGLTAFGLVRPRRR